MKSMFRVIMLLVFLALIVATNVYFTSRFSWIFSIESKTWLYVLFAIIPVAMITGMIGLSNAVSFTGHILYILSAVITGVMLYLLMAFLLADLLKLVFQFSRQIYAILAFSLVSTIMVFGILNSYHTRLTEHHIPMNGIKDEVRILHMSDIHLGHFRSGNFLKKITDMGMKKNPDLVVITGDLFDGRRELAIDNLIPLGKLGVPVYFVEGNHDGYTGVKEIKQLLRNSGVRVLENEVESFNGLQIVGLEHMRSDENAPAMHAVMNGHTIKEVISGLKIDPESPSVLLHHSPDGIEYAHEQGIDLYLAGHTHGGQMFPVNFINNWIFRYNKGIYNYKDTRIFVSTGAGTFGPPMRLGTKGEVSLLRLTGKKEE